MKLDAIWDVRKSGLIVTIELPVSDVTAVELSQQERAFIYNLGFHSSISEQLLALQKIALQLEQAKSTGCTVMPKLRTWLRLVRDRMP